MFWFGLMFWLVHNNKNKENIFHVSLEFIYLFLNCLPKKCGRHLNSILCCRCAKFQTSSTPFCIGCNAICIFYNLGSASFPFSTEFFILPNPFSVSAGWHVHLILSSLMFLTTVLAVPLALLALIVLNWN